MTENEGPGMLRKVRDEVRATRMDRAGIQAPGMFGVLVKLAAIREPGVPIGVTAPCWFQCRCGGPRMPAFSGGQVCACGKRYDGSGWLVA